MNTCVIVVPVYNEVPNELEQLSLKQLDTIINDDTEICLVGTNQHAQTLMISTLSQTSHIHNYVCHMISIRDLMIMNT